MYARCVQSTLYFMHQCVRLNRNTLSTGQKFKDLSVIKLILR